LARITFISEAEAGISVNSDIEKLFEEIASLVRGAKPACSWTHGRYVYEGIAMISKGVCTFTRESGEEIGRAPGFAISRAFQALRIEMAKLNEPAQAWYTAQCEVTPDGKFKFAFDHARLPAFDIIPSPEKWLDEFNRYARPELQEQVQDWIDGKAAAAEIVERLRQLHAG
jgi:hypothetical protein